MLVDYFEVLKRVKEHCAEAQKLGHNVVYTALQGSQNYGAAYEGSDVDTKNMVLPCFNDVVLNKRPVSYTHEMLNSEHVDVKDARLLLECFRKQNPNFVEVLFTDFYVVNGAQREEVMCLRENAEMVARYNNYASVASMAGMAMEKYKALEHPYPTIKWKIDKWGYDGKQLHHMMRMEQFMRRYCAGDPYGLCLDASTYPNFEELMAAKRNEFSLEKAREKASACMGRVNKFREEYMASRPLLVNEEAKEMLDEVLVSMLRKSLKLELS